MKHTVTIVVSAEDGQDGYDLSVELTPEGGKNILLGTVAPALVALGVNSNTLAAAEAAGGIKYAAD